MSVRFRQHCFESGIIFFMLMFCLMDSGLANERILDRDKVVALLASGNLDLSNVEMPGVDLSKIDFKGANLFGANLKDANLSGANLRGCNLDLAILRDANLAAADLRDLPPREKTDPPNWRVAENALPKNAKPSERPV